MIARHESSKIWLLVSVLAQSYLVLLLGVVVAVISARGLSVADRGLLAVSLLGVQFASRLSSIGFEQLIHKNGAKGGLSIYYTSGTLIAVLLAPFLFLYIRNLGIPCLTASFLILSLIATIILRSNVALFINNEKIGILTFINVTQVLINITLYLIVLPYREVSYFILSWSAAVIIACILSCIMVFRSSGAVFYSVISAGNVVSIWKQGVNYASVVLPEMALTFCLELPLIRHVLGSTQAGLYSISNTFTGVYYQAFASSSAIFIRHQEHIKRTLLYPAIFILGVIMVLVSPYVIEYVFGRDYGGSFNYIVYMMPVVYLLGLYRIERSVRDIRDDSFGVWSSILLIVFMYLGGFIEIAPVFIWIVFCYTTFGLLGLINIFTQRRGTI